MKLMGKKPNHNSPTKKLLMEWRPGQVLTSAGMRARGISKRLTSHLKANGTLASIGEGAYRKATETPPWTAGVEAIERELNMRVHVGGKTALELRGVAQYAALGQRAPVWLFGQGKTKLPKWFVEYYWDAKMRLVQTELFQEGGLGISELKTAEGFQILASRRERAVLEAIHLIGKDHRFEEVAELFDGLGTLDPAVLQSLLESCRSFKVRRVFLYLSRESGHDWYSRLDESKIDCGKGKREVVKGGALDARYHITVPRKAEVPDV